RGEVGDAARGFDRRRAVLVAGSFVPPAIVGYALERPIERHLGTPPTIAAGLVVGAAAMALADACGGAGRRREDAGWRAAPARWPPTPPTAWSWRAWASGGSGRIGGHDGRLYSRRR